MKQFIKKFLSYILAILSFVVIKKYKPYVIAVVGNVGKTSTKDAIYSAISPYFFVRKSQKSFNSEIGVPLTILGVPNAWGDINGWLKNIWRGIEMIWEKEDYPTHLVLEVGADKPRDIAFISRWLHPDMVVFTSVPKVPVHIEFFNSREEMVKEKSLMVRSLKKGGSLILNLDDDNFEYLRSLRPNARLTTYGLHEGANIRAENPEVWYTLKNRIKQPSGMVFDIVFSLSALGGVKMPVGILGVLGMQHIYPFLSASAVALELGLSNEQAVLALSDHKPPNGRMSLIDGINNSVIVDDTYNSSPIALEEALKALKLVNDKRRTIAVLGDMLELGKHSNEEHYNLGKEIARVCDVLVAVGMRSKGFGKGAIDAGMKKDRIFYFENSKKAGEFLENFILKKDLILVKGSQGMRMERVVEDIIADKRQIENRLVRQEDEWKKR